MLTKAKLLAACNDFCNKKAVQSTINAWKDVMERCNIKMAFCIHLLQNKFRKRGYNLRVCSYRNVTSLRSTEFTYFFFDFRVSHENAAILNFI